MQRSIQGVRVQITFIAHHPLLHGLYMHIFNAKLNTQEPVELRQWRTQEEAYTTWDRAIFLLLLLNSALDFLLSSFLFSFVKIIVALLTKSLEI